MAVREAQKLPALQELANTAEKPATLEELAKTIEQPAALELEPQPAQHTSLPIPTPDYGSFGPRGPMLLLARTEPYKVRMLAEPKCVRSVSCQLTMKRSG